MGCHGVFDVYWFSNSLAANFLYLPYIKRRMLNNTDNEENTENGDTEENREAPNNGEH